MTARDGEVTPLSAESTSRHIEVAGTRIRYHEAGSGPALMLIHGGAPGAFGWGNFGQNVPALSRVFRTIVVDLPGYGGSQKRGLPAEGRNAFAAEVFSAMLTQLEIERAHLLGLATGGAVAMRMAIEHPDQVDRLVLVSTSGGLPIFTPSPSEGARRIGQYYRAPGPTLERMREYLEMIVTDHGLISDALVQERFEASIDPEFVAAAMEGRGVPPRPEPIWQDLHRIAAPTLVVWGRDNSVQGYDNALFLLNRIPDVRVHIFGKTGLWVPFERRSEFNALVLGFLAGIGAGD